MYIGIDATCWWNRRGFGRFTRELLKAMLAAPRGHRFCLFIDRPPEQEMNQPHARIVQVPVARSVTASAVAAGNRSISDVWRFSRAASAEPVDVMFFPAVYSWFPLMSRVPVAVTLHDAIAEHFPELIFPNRRGRLLWRCKMRSATWQARRIITVSHAAKQEIMQYIGVRGESIDVICEGTNALFHPVTDPERRAEARRAAGLPSSGKLLLYVGGIAPHKNLSNLATGFAQAISRTGLDDVHLAIVGDPAGDGFFSSFDALVQQVKSDSVLRGRVHFAGFVPDENLAALYSDALATILPSLSEGFGLPALESLACGTPVLTTAMSATAEVVGEAGLTFNPHDPAAIAGQIYRAATETATWMRLRDLALPRARSYTWQKAAALTFQSLETCAGKT
jgi:glycosyltransferase involved in cell wall biosynthesis